MNKLLLCLLLTVIMLLPKSLFAIFSIDKTFLLLDDYNRNANITIYNNSDFDHDYFVFLDHYKQNENGSYVKVDKETSALKFADNYLLYTPIKFTIKKHSSQMVRLQRRSMAKADNGEYISYLTVKEYPKKEDNSNTNEKNKVNIVLTPIFNMAFPVIIRKGSLQSTFDISNVKLLKKNKKYFLAVTVKVNGNKSIRGNLKITYKKVLIAEVKDVNVFAYAKVKTILNDISLETLKKYNNKSLEVSFSTPDSEKIMSYHNNL